MKMIYIAGKFSGKTRADVELNIQAAVARGLEVAAIGGFPIIPHANTAHPDFETLQPYGFWIEGTMLQMLTCDALLTVPGWEQSSGARGEVLRMLVEGNPVFHTIEELQTWLEVA